MVPRSAVVLTPREREVLRLTCQGLSNKEIAGILRVRTSTVKAHLGSIYSKLDATGRVQAAMLAVARGYCVADGADPAATARAGMRGAVGDPG